MHVDGSARPYEGEDAARDQTRQDATDAAEEEAAAAGSAVLAADASASRDMIDALPDEMREKVRLLDVLFAMEAAIPDLPQGDSTRMAFAVMCWPLRARLGLPPDDHPEA